MALKAGYKGIKKSALEALMVLVGAKVIKTIGDGLSLSDAGLLAASIDSDTMEFKDGKISAKASSIQLEVFPEASASNEGQIRQYIGSTNANYTNGFFYKSVRQTEKKNPVMTSSTEPSGEASASTSYASPARPAWYAFDNSSSTYWTSEANKKIGEYIQYEFSEATVITSVKTKNTPEGTYKSVAKGFKVQGSNDGTDFTDLAEVTDNPLTTGYEYTVEFDNSTAYKYYRLLCTAVWDGDPANSVGFANIDLLGPTDTYSWNKINVQ